jgi:hypothetical protein
MDRPSDRKRRVSGMVTGPGPPITKCTTSWHANQVKAAVGNINIGPDC